MEICKGITQYKDLDGKPSRCNRVVKQGTDFCNNHDPNRAPKVDWKARAELAEAERDAALASVAALREGLEPFTVHGHDCSYWFCDHQSHVPSGGVCCDCGLAALLAQPNPGAAIMAVVSAAERFEGQHNVNCPACGLQDALRQYREGAS